MRKYCTHFTDGRRKVREFKDMAPAPEILIT